MSVEEVNTNTVETITRAAVEANENIKLCDHDDETNLDLFCYIECKNDSPDFVKDCRGVVFDGDELVLRSFSYNDEFAVGHPAVKELVEPHLKESLFFEAREGTLLRVFHYKDKWFISTHRKLDAFHSKWASRESFGEIFARGIENEFKSNPAYSSLELGENETVLEKFLSTLDKGKQYMFHLSTTKDTRIVCDAPEEPTVYYVGTFDAGVFGMEDFPIPTPTKIAIESFEHLEKYVSESNCFTNQGVVVYLPNLKQIKVLNPKYEHLFKVRGNEPSVMFRYLQVRMDTEMGQDLSYLYPEFREKFQEYENYLYRSSKIIHDAYIARYVKKIHTVVPKAEFQIIKECHKWHCADRTNNKVTRDVVVDFMNKSAPTTLNSMIRGHKVAEYEKTKVLQPILRAE